MSPGFTPRPSLSGNAGRAGRRHCLRVAGVHTSAFVERTWGAFGSTSEQNGVAGVHTSAFVERCRSRSRATARRAVSPGFTPRPSLSGPRRPAAQRRRRVSPGFTPRPSLSEGRGRYARNPGPRVAGVHTSAFVERSSGYAAIAKNYEVSPGFTPRPSLSGFPRAEFRGRSPVSPGFTPRPSLSAYESRQSIWAKMDGVAGVHTSAFVERSTRSRSTQRVPPVSPGFTPRPSLSGPGRRLGRDPGRVSPGFTPRPSLSGHDPGPPGRGRGECRRGSHLGLR